MWYQLPTARVDKKCILDKEGKFTICALILVGRVFGEIPINNKGHRMDSVFELRGNLELIIVCTAGLIQGDQSLIEEVERDICTLCSIRG